ncbi:alpha/beta hydrolase [Psychrosphaera sp. F3M07]|uniref:alpha/beta hydrolase n=1 Tax=Psychrosphaera sp. F3M07 TaxID=2841560 RepID=UPI001C088624|nr:alpha/beta hydrolase [Psychrosphaera sp. F3M07]MBU2916450.1 alpha/beta hydrolase [Psychrosphaera sp. F3M07]
MRGTLAPHLEEFIGQLNQAAEQAIKDGVVSTPELARTNLAKLSAFVTKSPDIAFMQNSELIIKSHNIPVRIYSPAPDERLPVLLYFHGGGHMCGDTQMYDPMCRKIALAANCVVISVEYRLAPEHPYPAGLDDAELVLRHYQTLLTDVAFNNQIMVGGDSAGGAICTSLVMRKAQGADLTIDKQVLIYPSVDYSFSFPSFIENGDGYLLTKARVQWYFENYFHQGESRKTVSPVFGPLDNNAPKTLVLTTSCDPLRDEGIAYHNRLIELGVSSQHYEFEGMVHAFMNLEDLVPDECALLFEKIGAFINS